MNPNYKLCLGLVASWEGHDYDCAKRQLGGPGDGVVIPVSSLPTHDGAEIARLTRALADSAELVLAGAAEVARLRGLIDGVDRALGRYRSIGDYVPLLDAAERAVNERRLP